MAGHRAFVPNGASRRDTAVLLIGTAKEYGIDVREIKAKAHGFDIPTALADVIYDEPKKGKTKASGKRAAKN